MAHIKLYTTDNCRHCETAKLILKREGMEFETINLSRKPQDRKKLVELTGNLSFPQIVVDGKPIGGIKELLTMERDGTIDQLAA